MIQNLNISEYKVFISKRAWEDYNDIRNYLVNKRYSDKYIKSVLGKLNSNILRLANSPKIFGFITAYDYASKGYRRCVADDYIIIYMINEEASVVQIITIVYAKRNYLDILSNRY